MRSTAVLIAGEVACRGMAFLTFVLVARHLGAESFGQYAFVFSFLSFFDILAMFGMNSIVVREMASRTEASARILKNAFLLRSVFIAMAIAVACLAALCMPVDSRMKALLCIGSLGLLISYRPIFEAIFRIRMSMAIPVGVSVLKAMLFLGLAVPLVYWRGGVLWFVAASVVSNLTGTALLMALAVRHMKPVGALDRTLCLQLLKESLPMVFSGLLTVLYIRVDVMMLTFMKGFESVGLYSAATRLSEAMSMVPAALMTTFFPILSEYATSDRRRFKAVMAQGFLYLLALIVPFVIFLRFYAGPVVSLLFKSRYEGSAEALSILVWSCLFVYPNILMVNAIVALRKQIWDTWFSLLSLAVNVVLNLWWIPAHGFLGSSWATVAAEAVQFVCLAMYLSRAHAMQIPWAATLRLAGLGALFYAGMAMVSVKAAWFLAAPLALGLYVPALFMVRVLREEDRRFFAQMAKRALALGLLSTPKKSQG